MKKRIKQTNAQKKKIKKHKIIYYEDALNDDFFGREIKKKKLNKNFKYIHKNIFWCISSFLMYYVIALPIVFFYMYIIKGVRFVNKKALKKTLKESGKGIFLYGNHTGTLDVYTPSVMSFPRRNQILASRVTVSIPIIKTIAQLVGAVPLPDNYENMVALTKSIDSTINHKVCFTIYPEAHIWPYYTGVRPFKDTAFRFPIRTNAPVIAFFTAYTKPTGIFRKFRKTNTTIYMSEPIYPDVNKSKKEAQKELRDKVYDFMKNCSEKYSTYSYIEYKHISEKPKEEISDELTEKDLK